MRVHALSDLKQVAQVLKMQREALQLRQAQEQARREAIERERHLFRHEVGAVTPLNVTPRAVVARAPVLPLPLQLEIDEQRALYESISDDFDVTTLMDTDEALSYRQPGVAPEVARKLRLGHWSIQASLDMHGLRLDEAREALGQFVRNCHKKGIRCVRIIHGKGHGSPGRVPILKVRVQRWLVQKQEVLAFVQAKASDGGAGAVVVLLDRAHRR
ncbi:DNA mismatch repair protein MutS [Lampropedia aestuarii]|uniref:DNA mismatch repair protein MutS n=1 Tax=Lampropedia aestuarii TaxID=2562762 RepID=A0A4V3YX71_9BURK|nr:Smr/MutS family protein [Lampropedia aestuarii]MDH5858525.1 Smr/MutS family protein [Lampropedia aestuarii]THJ34062.1 DNA mismatch repair protein MutS [Lampropedia aestuarii]